MRRGSAPCTLLTGSGIRHLHAKSNRELSPAGVRAASASRRGNLRRHHSQGHSAAAAAAGQAGSCRGSVPAEAVYAEDMLRRMSIDGGGGGGVNHHFDVLKAQVLLSLTSSSSPSCAGKDQLIQDVKSSLSMINSRRGSLPTDFAVSSFAVK